MRSVFDGVVYDIPVEEVDKLKNYINRVWRPSLDRGLCSDNGPKRIPTNVRALSFSLFLREWYKNNFSKYIVDETENDLIANGI